MLSEEATLRLLRKIRKQVGLNITEIDQAKDGVIALMKKTVREDPSNGQS